MDTREYWESRYVGGGNSGLGSRGKFAQFKSRIVNEFIRENGVVSVLDLGCGDGVQAGLLEVVEYTGVDVSKKAVEMCEKKFPFWEFYTSDKLGELGKFDLVLSMDVIFHLLEDDEYEQYMGDLFSHSSKYVIIYSSDREGVISGHMREHKFTDWIRENAKEWELVKRVGNEYPYNSESGNGSMSDFYIFKFK